MLGEHYPIFADAERVIADPIVRNRGTIGGSLCQADPSEDLSAVAAALRADMVIRSAAGTRTVPAREFHDGPYETVVGHGRDPHRDPGADPAGGRAAPTRRSSGGSATGPSPRPAPSSCSTATTVGDVGIGLTAVGAAHFCAPDAEDVPAGPAGDRGEPGRGRRGWPRRRCNPSADQRGPADYKRHLAGELTLRALRRAVARARGEGA